MCWGVTASLGMAGLGAAAAVVTHRRGEPAAIWLTLGYFSVMEALQAAGYGVIDQCDLGTNKTVTLLSYLHIAFQPLFINAFAMELLPVPVKARLKPWIYAVATLATAIIVLRLFPLPYTAPCQPGDLLCGAALCTISGEWHLGWTLPLSNLSPPLGPIFGWSLSFPEYLVAAFVLPACYGAWRFALFHLLIGPVLAAKLTSSPNEMPAVWCLFSIGIIFFSLSPVIRQKALGVRRGPWPGSWGA